LLLFFVFAAVRTGYGQTTDYAALRSAGRVEHWAGHFEKAGILLRSALEVAQRGGDADEQALAAQILHSLSTVYFRQENMSRAEALMRQAIGIRSAARTDSDLVDAQILSNLGAIFQRQHKYGKAEESYKGSLEITEQQLGLFHPYLTLTLGNPGGLYTEMGRHSQVEGQYRRSLTILDQMSGSQW